MRSSIIVEVRDCQLLEIQKQWQNVRELDGQRASSDIKIDGKFKCNLPRRGNNSSSSIGTTAHCGL